MKKLIWSAMLALVACTADVNTDNNLETDTDSSVDTELDTDAPEVDETGEQETGSEDTDVIDTDALDTDTGSTEPQRIDNDGDGFTQNEGDCNDADPSINPGALEVCDGVDQNCNIAIDDSVIGASDWYEDADRDGFGSLTGRVFGGPLLGRCSPPTSSPMGPVYYVQNHLDCDDTDPNVGPCP